MFNLNQGKHSPYPELNSFLLMFCQLEGLNPDCFYEEPIKTILKEGDGVDTHKRISIKGLYKYTTPELRKKWDNPLFQLEFFSIIRQFGPECFKADVVYT
jgi:hypothetical protein